MDLNLLDHKEVIKGFIKYIEENFEILQNIEVKDRATIVENIFKSYFEDQTKIKLSGSAAKGIDLPEFNTDLKFTCSNQPQSSSPYKSVHEKLFGLDYNLLLFTYENTQTNFKIKDCIFIPKEKTGCKNASKFIEKTQSDTTANLITKDITIKALKGWIFSVTDKSSHEITGIINKYSNNNITVDEFIAEVNSWSIIEPIDLKPDWDNIYNKMLTITPPTGIINYSFALQWRLSYSKLTKNNLPEGIINLLDCTF
mgnify:CR=1 FL=1